jgi:hypothetical protein
MINETIIPGTLNEQKKTRDLYSGIIISGIPGGVDNKEIEEATWSSRAEAMRNTQSRMKQMDKKKEEPLIVDPYNRPIYSGQAPAIIRPSVGYMPGDEEEGPGVLSGFSEMYRYFTEDVPQHYKPFHNVEENLPGFVKNKVMNVLWTHLEPALRPQSELLANFADGFRISTDDAARGYAMDLSPLLGRLVTGYAPGKSYIENVWVYNKEYRGTTYKVPVFFNTFNDTETPSESKLVETMEFVDNDLISPYDNMDVGESANYINKPFITFWAEGYTWPYKPYFEQEPTHAHRWFNKDDTKGAQNWMRLADDSLDSEGTPLIPVPLRGKIEVYRKNASRTGLLYNMSKHIYGIDVPVSSGLAWSNIGLDLCQDVAFTLGGGIAVAKFLESIGAEETGLRRIMERYYILGNRLYGLDHPFTYDIRQEGGYTT